MHLTRAVIGTVALLWGAGAAVSSAQAASSTPLQVSVTLRPIISLSVFQDLNFGEVIVGQGPSGSFEIRPDGSVAFSGSGLTPAASVSPQAGQIDIAGQQGLAIDVSCASAVVANSAAETFEIGIQIAAAALPTGVSCAGLGTPVLTMPQTQAVSSVFVGGQIDAADLASLSSYEQFSSANASGVPAVFQAVYQ